MQQCNLYEAKARLSQLVQAALDGEEVLIARAGKPAVRLVPVSEQIPATTGWGSLNIEFEALDAAFAPDIEQEVAKLFEGKH
ncbi:MAG: type II toxin-antitoxin system prevent-host-death family antitoxin [Sulfuricellaceae bacterium]|nr:type II toxin-antitoxin system prevent-host-death family antitoxin [Sulfuricellaceae bacterium]